MVGYSETAAFWGFSRVRDKARTGTIRNMERLNKAVPVVGHEETQRCGLDVSKLSVLFDDPAMALWANETGSRYRISCLDALGALASALLSMPEGDALGSAGPQSGLSAL